MTPRARWLALPALAALFLSLIRGQATLSLVSLSVLIWLLTEWAIFLWRSGMEVSRLQFVRSVNGHTGERGYLWAGRDVDVEVEVSVRSGAIGSLLLLQDVLPENFGLKSERSGGNLNSDGTSQSADEPAAISPPASTNGRAKKIGSPALPANQILVTTACRKFRFLYRGSARAAGRLRLPGIRITLMDANGFFRRSRFIEAVQEFRVLPACAAHSDLRPLVKRVNSLPQHGIHRLQRSGMGSELLELREYVAGDPPKSIAWKVSARRDKLMTRQYESEVPVRGPLFVDGSIATRVGGFGVRLLDQMNWVAASIARAAISVGDPIGAMMFDERGVVRVPAVSGEKGYYRLLEALSDFSENPEPVADRLSQGLIDAAAAVGSERFPELFDPRYNQIPFSIFPILPFARRRYEQRVQLAAVMAEVYQLTVQDQARLIHDDVQLAAYLQTFLSQSGMAWIDPVVAVRGRGHHDGVHRMQLLSDAMAQAVARARDNEVFVILADLLECAHGLPHLTAAIRMALGRHHRVAFVCPSPTFFRPQKKHVLPAAPTAESMLLAAEQIRVRAKAEDMQRELRKLGATVAISGEFNAVQMVMSEIDLARSGRLAVAGGRR
ncbi:MAG: DUF58 domain-containing protein [Planctomycetaceae bacterium]|nr:DUF58 domain-containing protein [Planctomycetaceae bacterium]